MRNGDDALVVMSRCSTSGREAQVAEELDSIWLYLTLPGSLKVDTVVWLLDTPAAPAEPSQEPYRGQAAPPPLPADLALPGGVVLSLLGNVGVPLVSRRLGGGSAPGWDSNRFRSLRSKARPCPLRHRRRTVVGASLGSSALRSHLRCTNRCGGMTPLPNTPLDQPVGAKRGLEVPSAAPRGSSADSEGDERMAVCNSDRGFMRGVPRGVYDRVHQYALDIVNASARGDRRGVAAAYRRLREYCRRQEARGLRHPFLPETLGDFAISADVRIGLYRHALQLARQRQLPQQTILLALAEVQLEMARVGHARRSVVAAKMHAGKNGDSDTEGKARGLLLQIEARRRTNGILTPPSRLK